LLHELAPEIDAYVPEGQLTQLVAALEDTYLPREQEVQLLAIADEYVPAEQDMQAEALTPA